jgi:hypothetical protein
MQSAESLRPVTWEYFSVLQGGLHAYLAKIKLHFEKRLRRFLVKIGRHSSEELLSNKRKMRASINVRHRSMSSEQCKGAVRLHSLQRFS